MIKRVKPKKCRVCREIIAYPGKGRCLRCTHGDRGIFESRARLALRLGGGEITDSTTYFQPPRDILNALASVCEDRKHRPDGHPVFQLAAFLRNAVLIREAYRNEDSCFYLAGDHTGVAHLDRAIVHDLGAKGQMQHMTAWNEDEWCPWGSGWLSTHEGDRRGMELAKSVFRDVPPIDVEDAAHERAELFGRAFLAEVWRGCVMLGLGRFRTGQLGNRLRLMGEDVPLTRAALRAFADWGLVYTRGGFWAIAPELMEGTDDRS